MATLPRCDELHQTVNSSEWEDMFILYYRRAISADLRLARVINGLCAGLIAIIEERENFVDELDILGDRFVPSKMAEFQKETQSGVVATGFGGCVPVFQEGEVVVCCVVATGVGGGVPVFEEDEAAPSDGIFFGSAGLYFSTSSPHGCPVILSTAGVKKVRGAIPELCGFCSISVFNGNLFLSFCFSMSSYGNFQIISGGFLGIWHCTCVVAVFRIL
ncbi:hypothetical protein Tco_1197248 [Tanacetum coccineum]